MRNTSINLISGIALLILIAGMSAKAQTQYRADIPFDFTIGEKSFKAGDYSIKVLNSDSSQKIVAIRELKGHGSYMTVATVGADISKVKNATIVFDRYLMQYSLARISTPSFVANLPRSKAAATIGLNKKPEQEIIAILPKN